MKYLVILFFSFSLLACGSSESTTIVEAVKDHAPLPAEASHNYPLLPEQEKINSKRLEFQQQFKEKSSSDQKLKIQSQWFNWLKEHLTKAKTLKVNGLINFRSSDKILDFYPVIGEFDIGNKLFVSRQENFKTQSDQVNSNYYKMLFNVDESKPVQLSFEIANVDTLMVARIGDTLEDPIIKISPIAIKNL